MAVSFAGSSNSKASWSDIVTLYESLRATQSKHKVSQTAIPSNANKVMQVGHASNLVDAIEALGTSASQITTSQALVDGTIPSIGDLITPLIFKECADTLTVLEGVAFNGSNFNFTTNSSNFTFTSNSSDFSFTSNGSNFSFSTNSSNHGFSTNSSNNGFSHGDNVSFNFGGYSQFGTNNGDGSCSSAFCPSR